MFVCVCAEKRGVFKAGVNFEADLDKGVCQRIVCVEPEGHPREL